jgi:hypothetical protein
VPERAKEGERNAVCTSSDPVILEAAIARLTRALTTADDDALPELVAERRALREELEERRCGANGNVVAIDSRRRDPRDGRSDR